MSMKSCLRAGVLLALMLVSACHRGLDPVAFQAAGRPPKLSDWHVLEVRGGKLVLNEGVVPYDLNTPLFTDYAHKLRTIWMPKGVAAKYDATDTFDFPVGTIISKTFYYPKAANGKFSDVARTYDSSRDFAGEGLDLANVHLIETRILVRREAGWAAIPYVWKDDQSDAALARTGAVIPLTLVADAGEREDFNYVVPDESQCSSCHAQDWVTRKIHPIGPKARHLNRDYHYADGRAEPARPPDEDGLSHRCASASGGAAQCELDGYACLARRTCARLSRYQLRALPQSQGCGQYHRADARCERARRPSPGYLQAARRGWPRHR